MIWRRPDPPLPDQPRTTNKRFLLLFFKQEALSSGGGDGFTLIEILVVLVIVGLMAGLLVTRGPLRSATLDLQSVGETMTEALRAARARAISTDQPVTFTLDTARHRYLVGTTATSIPGGIALAMQAAAGEAVEANRAGITFAPDGSSTGGTIALALGERRIAINVNWLTGRISLSDAP